jgi:bacterioferritin-associated ferredoxin
MILCTCYNVNDKALLSAIMEAPLISSDPYSDEYMSTEDQVYDYVREKHNVGDCACCEDLIRSVIRVHRTGL